MLPCFWNSRDTVFFFFFAELIAIGKSRACLFVHVRNHNIFVPFLTLFVLCLSRSRRFLRHPLFSFLSPISTLHFLKYRHKQSLASCLSGQKAVHRPVADKRTRYVPIVFRGHFHEFCAQFRGYPCHILLVLMSVESAGGIYEQASGAQSWPNVADNLAL